MPVSENLSQYWQHTWKFLSFADVQKNWEQILTMAGTWSHKNMCGCRNYNYTMSYGMLP